MQLANAGAMRTVASLASLSCVALGAGCSSSPETFYCAGYDHPYNLRAVGLADLPDLRPEVQYFGSNAPGAKRHDVRVIAYYGERVAIGGRPGLVAPLGAGSSRYCAEADPSIIATFNGVELSTEQTGDWACPGPVGGLCSVPRFALDDAAVAPDADLVLEDGSRSISIGLGDILLDRTATLVGGGDWTFRPGQTVTVRWSPATDFTTLPDTAVSFNEACDGCDHPREVFRTTDLTRTEDMLAFTVPEESVTATGNLAISLSTIGVEHRLYTLTMSQRFIREAMIAP
jgi:hypothetical protein